MGRIPPAASGPEMRLSEMASVPAPLGDPAQQSSRKLNLVLHLTHRTPEKQAAAAYTPTSGPNISTAMTEDAMGALVAPANKALRPMAAPAARSSPSKGAAQLPAVAPMKKMGNITPPLHPLPKVTAVKTSFQRKAAGGSAAPARACSIVSLPMPRYSVPATRA